MKCGTVVYGHQSADIQDVIVKTDSPDPIYGYFKLKTEATGSLRVVKQYKDLNGNNVKSGIESFILNNTKFKIRNSANKYIKASYSGSGYVYSYTGYVSSASDSTVFTPKNNSGDFYYEVNKLPPGTYEIIEQNNNISGYTPSGSTNIKVAVTANNSGGRKIATFQNKPDQLVINKIFNQFGAVKDEDYASNDFSRVNSIDINETIRYDNARKPFAPNCDKWDSRDPVCMLCKINTTENPFYREILQTKYDELVDVNLYYTDRESII